MYFIIRDDKIHAGPFDSMTQARGVEGSEQGDEIVGADNGRVMFHISTNGKWEKLRYVRILDDHLLAKMRAFVQKHLEEGTAHMSSAERVHHFISSVMAESQSEQAADMVSAPPHYNQAGIECIDAITAATSGKSGIEAVCVANVVKYLWRYELENGVEDVKKARWYLDRLIGELEK
ncbi:hypothetical protein OTAKU_00420 [Serratia phage vB_SmaM-Otaku]|uniref:DUF3310 domain-containing protein n=1 Tax=Serratia phage vB_SmaM-Otaku TaxID=2932867 RepID=A0AAE9KRP4_9CAUD|nr:hypothetical protein PF631_gp42 [Serratia phage vB_SmaM-Otaku]UPU16031.1 hypothetical protein OTAKU_00420 [Serratia phage vB_SmaM-Otaku]